MCPYVLLCLCLFVCCLSELFISHSHAHAHAHTGAMERMGTPKTHKELNDLMQSMATDPTKGTVLRLCCYLICCFVV